MLCNVSANAVLACHARHLFVELQFIDFRGYARVFDELFDALV
jgi:hypothetical protein